VNKRDLFLPYSRVLMEVQSNQRILQDFSLEIFKDTEKSDIEGSVEAKERMLFEKRMDREGYKRLAVQCFPRRWTNSFFMIGSESAAKNLSVDLQIFQNANNIDLTTGSKLWAGSVCYAENYGGHQYGIFRNLGDGRTVTIGYVKQQQIQLRGSMRTPYGQQKDGHIPLSASIYEHFLFEYLSMIGIPSARSLYVLGSTNPCSRMGSKETMHSCGISARYCPSWIRFGTLEHLHYRGEEDRLKVLVDHLIQTFYPECLKLENEECIVSQRLISSDIYDDTMDSYDESILKKSDNMTQGPVTLKLNRYALFFRRIIDKTAKLVAKWQANGFVHGLLNTVSFTHLGKLLCSRTDNPCVQFLLYGSLRSRMVSQQGRHRKAIYFREPTGYGSVGIITSW
jgi:uncharacterized protein YdiU (UPF0061 family)